MNFRAQSGWVKITANSNANIVDVKKQKVEKFYGQMEWYSCGIDHAIS